MPRVQVPVTTISPPKSSLTTALAGANNDLTFTARNGGPGGNSIRIEYVVAGNNTPLTVVVSGYDITVNVATTGAGAANSSASAIKTALEANLDVIKLISIALATGNDGTGIVTALALTALSGGSLAIAPPTQTDGDTTNGHYITGADEYTYLEAQETGGVARTVTVEYSPNIAPIVDVPGEVISIPANATRILGPFSPSAFHQNQTQDVYFTPSVSTTVKFRAYKTARAA